MIGELYAEQERSVGELAALLGEPQPKISNHLACLRWCGFVTTRREHHGHHRLHVRSARNGADDPANHDAGDDRGTA